MIYGGHFDIDSKVREIELLQQKMEQEGFWNDRQFAEKTLKEITSLLQDNEDIVKVYVSNNFLTVNINGVIVVSRLLEGTFADYKKIIPTEFTTFCVVNKDQFESTLERVSLIAKFDKNNIVKFDAKENNILITSNGEIGDIKENLPANLTGNDLMIAFNSRYFSVL